MRHTRLLSAAFALFLPFSAMLVAGCSGNGTTVADGTGEEARKQKQEGQRKVLSPFGPTKSEQRQQAKAASSGKHEVD